MAEQFVDAAYLQDTAKFLRHLKEQTYALMRIQPGGCVLDVGCGPGVDTIPLARYVGATGRVIGVDVDAEMLAKADEFARKEGVSGIVSHRVAGAQALPFEAGTFDACRAERLFQVLPRAIDPQAVLTELLRALKPGGWLVLADTDWATASVDMPNLALERKLMGFFGEHVRPNGFAGRQFFRWMRERGLLEIDYLVFPVISRQFGQTPFGDWLRQEARAAHIASDAELDEWSAALEARDAAGTFFSVVNMNLVAGRKP